MRTAKSTTSVSLSALAMVVALLGSVQAQADTASKGSPKSVLVHMETSDGRDAGIATLVQSGSSVKVTVDFKNLDPGEHAIHLHEHPMCDAPEFKTAGGHFNPGGKQHGTENPQGHHAGDFPLNLTVGDDGMVKKTFTTKDITLDPNAPNSVFANGGTSIMVHTKADDMKTDPSGNAGGREACGIVKISNASNSTHVLGGKGQTESPSNH